ncbi:hypothetical protein D3C72_2417590 [compost metagenome]
MALKFVLITKTTARQTTQAQKFCAATLDLSKPVEHFHHKHLSSGQSNWTLKDQFPQPSKQGSKTGVCLKVV